MTLNERQREIFAHVCENKRMSVEELAGIFQKSNLDNSVFKAVLKALGLCYITNFASDTCRDFGQTSLASKVELAGKISIVILTLPLINSILSVALELIG